jgi:Transmembrane protein of unknown function (DUF3556)
MGFLKPTMPRVDLPEWRTRTRPERMKPMARHIAESGMGNPEVFFVLYGIKIVLYVLGGLCFALATAGIDGWSQIGTWWAEPIVFQKIVLWTLLFEVVGFGCGFGPLTGKIAPPMGSILYWSRPGTIRLAPWPGRVPFTAGDRRSVSDVVLYAALLVSVLVALLSDGTGPVEGLATSVGLLPFGRIVPIVVILAILGLRDKTIFLAARGEVYGALAVTFLFTGPNMVVAAKLVLVAIWMGAAISKLNRHFPFVIATMMSNNPLVRPKWLKRLFYRKFPDDLRPSWIPTALAHVGTLIELCVPMVLFFSHGGVISAIAAAVIISLHLVILTAFPLGVPLEWNVFMIFGVATLFLDKADIGVGQVTQPWLIAALMAVIVTVVAMGNLNPTKVSFLPGMRYYAGNWDCSQWFFTEEACRKIAEQQIGLGLLQHKQIEKLSGAESAEIALGLGQTFRAMFAHGRALMTLWDHVIPAGREHDYVVLDGEPVAAYAIGYSFGDGHLHNEQLVHALQRRCHFLPGELRILMLDGQAIQHQFQEYRIVDAAIGELERGRFRVRDTAGRQPWEHDVPIQIISGGGDSPNR